ncbi:MAG: lysophospholipid acyltransferase family protein [Pirellulales bacterium]
MQDVVFDKPYKFVPPVSSRFWPTILQLYLPRYLRIEYGVQTVECRHADRLRTSLEAGRGILLAPNHCRMSDPLVLGILARRVRAHLYAMASWHLFMQGRFTTFMIRRMGAFSVYREGMDKKAISTAIEILEEARRPLVIFPEGAVSRHNDVLMPLMDGTAMIARTAAKRREKKGVRGVVVHPIALRYYFRGDLEATLSPVLNDIEARLSWHPQIGGPLMPRIRRIGEALLSLKEIEYFGAARQGDPYQRVAALIDHLLLPLEQAWSVPPANGSVVVRVKNLRSVILSDMVNGDLPEAERERRWKELADCYLAQQMSHYPRDYVRRENNIPERVLETVERFEEDLTDRTRIRGPLDVVLSVGEAIEVEPRRDRSLKQDPVMQAIEKQLRDMLAELVAEGATRPIA